MAHPSVAAIGSRLGERRASPRYNMAGVAVVIVGNSSISARVQNISLGGCALQLTAPPPPPGSVVRLRLAINGTEFELLACLANLQMDSVAGFQFRPTSRS